MLLGASTAQIFQGLGPEDLRDQGRPLEVEVLLARLGPAEWTAMPHEPSISSIDQSETLRIRLDVAIDPGDQEAITVRRFPDSGHDRGITREQLEVLGWRYLPATRGTAASQLDGPASAVHALLNAAELGPERDSLARLLKQLDRYQEFAVLTEQIVQVSEEICEARPVLPETGRAGRAAEG